MQLIFDFSKQPSTQKDRKELKVDVVQNLLDEYQLTLFSN